jgi:peptide/nickel transport system substrate-binding protein
MNSIKRSKKKIAIVAGGLAVVAIPIIIALTGGGSLAGTGGKESATATTAPTISSSTNAQKMEAVSKNVRLDPAVAPDQDSLKVSGYLYEGLVKLDAQGKPAAALAVDWEISDDGLDYLFTLRPKVVFQDGKPFNADAVLANFNRWFDPQNALHGSLAYDSWKQYFLGFKGDLQPNKQPVSFFDGIEKSNDLSIMIHLNRPEPKLLEYLAQPYFVIASPGALTVGGSQYGTQNGGAAGTGPYSLVGWQSDGLLLQPNAKYWGSVPSESLLFPWK